MNVVAEVKKEGAYGFECRLSLLRSRRGRPYLQTSGFQWVGNQGGRHTYRTPLTEEGAEKASIFLQMAEEGEIPMGDVEDLLNPDKDFAGPTRGILD